MTTTHPPDTAVNTGQQAPAAPARTTAAIPVPACNMNHISRSMAELQTGDDSLLELLALSRAAPFSERTCITALQDAAWQTTNTREVLRALADQVRAKRRCQNSGCPNQTETPKMSYCSDLCRDEAGRQRRKGRQ
jgi:hypothetical protein